MSSDSLFTPIRFGDVGAYSVIAYGKLGQEDNLLLQRFEEQKRLNRSSAGTTTSGGSSPATGDQTTQAYWYTHAGLWALIDAQEIPFIQQVMVAYDTAQEPAQTTEVSVYHNPVNAGGMAAVKSGVYRGISKVRG